MRSAWAERLLRLAEAHALCQLNRRHPSDAAPDLQCCRITAALQEAVTIHAVGKASVRLS